MARMHSRKRGKSGSTKPSKVVKKVWVRYSDKELELIITKLAKEGKTTSQIGIVLRDTYGIPNVKTIINKSLSHFLKEKELNPEVPEALSALIRRAVAVKKHLDKNKKDQPARFGLNLTEAKIKRLAKYYKRTGALPTNWKYDLEKTKLFID